MQTETCQLQFVDYQKIDSTKLILHWLRSSSSVHLTGYFSEEAKDVISILYLFQGLGLDGVVSSATSLKNSV